MNRIVRTDVLIDDSGREYDLGHGYKRIVYLKELTRDEAISAYVSGKRVYYIYKNNRIYHTDCRKVCKNLIYLKWHYDCYHETCGVICR